MKILFLLIFFLPFPQDTTYTNHGLIEVTLEWKHKKQIDSTKWDSLGNGVFFKKAGSK